MSTDLTIEYLIRDAHDSFRPHVTPGPWKLKHGVDHGHCCSWTSEGSAQVNGFGLLKCVDRACTNVMLYQVPVGKN